MIWKISSVLIVAQIIYNVKKSFGQPQHFRFLFIARTTVLNCSNDQHIYITDWAKFRHSALWNETQEPCQLSDKDMFFFDKTKFTFVNDELVAKYCLNKESIADEEKQRYLANVTLFFTIENSTIQHTTKHFEFMNQTERFCFTTDPGMFKLQPRANLYFEVDQYPIFFMSFVKNRNAIHTEDAERIETLDFGFFCYQTLQSDTIHTMDISHWEKLKQEISIIEKNFSQMLADSGAYLVDRKKVTIRLVEILR